MKGNHAIIVISGLPRSGTSMMMKMLQNSGIPILTDHLRKADQDNPKGYYELERVKALHKDADKSWLRESEGKAIKVISSLLTELPPRYTYKVIFMLRNLEEVLASQNKMLVRRGEPVDPKNDARMKELYEKHLVKIKDWLTRQSNFEVLELNYADVVGNPLEQASRVKDFLAMDLDLATMVAAVERKLYRNRATI
ncbi:MAG: sulfotransferase domain-containing protein [Acidobacteriota bacterium]